ncbi:RIP metalloprotease RseP [Pelagibacteraceae bacterium]|nr:RIP metalloprotease RseP [Pelagibacteraceae bacterium]
MEILNFILPFLVLLTIVVFVHEYGHYYFARKYNVGVTDFSIGFGKEIFGFNDTNGTRWKFCLIPLGGYVKFFGDRNVFSQEEQENILKRYNETDKKKLFVTKPLYQRSLIVFGGPLANFILAIVIFAFIYMVSGKDFTPAKISEVQENSPAFVSGLRVNDIITSINDNKIKSVLEVSTHINASTKNIIEVEVLRNQQELSFLITPKEILSEDNLGNKAKRKIIGIKISPLNNEFNKQKLGPAKAIYYATNETWFVTKTTLKFVGSMFKGQGDSSQLGGPIRIAKITGQVAQFGIIAFLSIMAYISISLGLINLFPIPLLDGGHLMFYAFEKILGRPLSQKTQESFFRIGLILLFSLMFFTTFNDLKDLGLF